MKIWVVIDRDRWGQSTSVVRAATKEEAIEFVHRNPNLRRIEVEELREGTGILWCHDESPDTPRDD